MSKDDGFREDIIIANDDGYLYHISQRDLRQGSNALGKSFRVDPQGKGFQAMYGDVLDMLSHGMVVGAVPHVPDDARHDVSLVVPVICYVLNIDSLKHYNCWQPWYTRTEPEPPRKATGEFECGGEMEAEAGA